MQSSTGCTEGLGGTAWGWGGLEGGKATCTRHMHSAAKVAARNVSSEAAGRPRVTLNAALRHAAFSYLFLRFSLVSVCVNKTVS